MSDIYRRFFKVTGGPVMDAALEAEAINDLAHEQYMVILAEIGAEHRYYHRDRRMTGIIFEGEVDRTLFRETRNGWWPKKNCQAGRELDKRIKAVQTATPETVLKAAGLRGRPHGIFSGQAIHYCSHLFVPSEPPVVFLSVPWRDVDPAKLAQYSEEREAGTHFNSEMDHLLWEPAEDLVEIKSWEMEREIDEYNAGLKEKRAEEVES